MLPLHLLSILPPIIMGATLALYTLVVLDTTIWNGISKDSGEQIDDIGVLGFGSPSACCSASTESWSSGDSKRTTLTLISTRVVINPGLLDRGIAFADCDSKVHRRELRGRAPRCWLSVAWR